MSEYGMELFEIFGDAMDECAEWADFEADIIESNPWNDAL